MRAREGFKFVIVISVRSMGKFAVGENAGLVALIPIDDTGNLKNVLAWDSYADVKKWMDSFKTVNGMANFKKLMALKPEIGEVMIVQ